MQNQDLATERNAIIRDAKAKQLKCTIGFQSFSVLIFLLVLFFLNTCKGVIT